MLEKTSGVFSLDLKHLMVGADPSSRGRQFHNLGSAMEKGTVTSNDYLGWKAAAYQTTSVGM